MNFADKSRWIKGLAKELGFQQAGIAPAGPVPRAGHYRRWLTDGRAGTMQYLHRHVETRLDPRRLLPGARSVIVVAHAYHQPWPDRPADDRARGRVAMYAWGRDYHRVMRKKLYALVDRMRADLDDPFAARVCVDTAPLLERELAAAAGVGWIGKNTLVMNTQLGSYFFLGAVVTTLELAPDTPITDHCGRCARCLQACPTGALDRPYEMDASKCISYLTIERRDDVPAPLRPRVGDWIYGCDVCQEVCPHNHRVPVAGEADYAPRPPTPYPVLTEVLRWTPADYDHALRGSAMRRATLAMLQRNARIALENTPRAG
jgi:epoxyqueuosine reductase